MTRGQIWQNFPTLLRFMALFPSLSSQHVVNFKCHPAAEEGGCLLGGRNVKLASLKLSWAVFPQLFGQRSRMVQDFHSCHRTPGPHKGSRRVSEEFLKGSPKGSLKGSWRRFEGFLKGSAFKTPSKRLQEPFENPSRRCRNRCVGL